MRKVGTLSSQQEALRFSSFLRHIQIAHTCEASSEPSNGYISYDIWVHDEDRLEEAREAFEKFLQEPADSLFDVPLEKAPVETEEAPALSEPATEEPPPLQRAPSGLTYLVLFVCIFVFFITLYQEVPLAREGAPEATFIFTPLQTACLYDLPPLFEHLMQLLQNPQAVSEVKTEVDLLPHLSYWRGIYDWLLLKIQTGDPSQAEGPLWIKLRQGELWRLISPCIVHGGFLHILFNMLWVWMLCRPVEQRLGFFRACALTLLVAIGSNTAQYLMGGPLFLGYSGVVMGLAGFIWSRQRVAPWEGYPVQRSTLLFLFFFILAMLALQVVSFLLQIFSSVRFSLNVANTAHLSGALFGALLGRLRYFSWRIIR